MKCWFASWHAVSLNEFFHQHVCFFFLLLLLWGFTAEDIQSILALPTWVFSPSVSIYCNNALPTLLCVCSLKSLSLYLKKKKSIRPACNKWPKQQQQIAACLNKDAALYSACTLQEFFHIKTCSLQQTYVREAQSSRHSKHELHPN